jgi:hypothetical protein
MCWNCFPHSLLRLFNRWNGTVCRVWSHQLLQVSPFISYIVNWWRVEQCIFIPRNSTVEANFRYENGSSSNGYYYLNNFENVISSYVTLFELTVINNWYIIMEGYAVTTTQWSRIYFMCFYLTIMMLLSIVVASVLDGFMFRISYKEKMTKEDGKKNICSLRS